MVASFCTDGDVEILSVRDLSAGNFITEFSKNITAWRVFVSAVLAILTVSGCTYSIKPPRYLQSALFPLSLLAL